VTTNADWFAKKLAQQNPIPQGRPDVAPPMPQSQQPLPGIPQFQQPVDPGAKAPSSRSYETCPDCGSGNYMSPNDQIGKRCYECGYPVSQSGSKFGGLSTARVEGEVTQAIGNNTANNWNPQGIIGRIQ
jgi:hypothetical protein